MKNIIVNAIIKEMIRRNWTMYKLAQESGLSQSTVHTALKEGKGSGMRTVTADRLLSALGLSVVRNRNDGETKGE